MNSLLIAIVMLFSLIGTSQTLIIHFDFNKADLSQISKSSIDSFLAIKKNKLAGAEFKISGHCDSIGSESYNYELSLRRLETVKRYLEDNYLDSGMISELNAYGERKPLNQNRTEEDRLANRRVEISIVQKELTQGSTSKIALKKTISDSTIKSGSRLVLKNINFVGGTHQLLPESHEPLQDLLDAMKSLPNLVIEIHGHICCSPITDDGFDSETGTFDLSYQRAKAVMKYLIENGINPNRVSCKGIGHFNPIYPFPEKNEFEMKENRRVEIQIVSK